MVHGMQRRFKSRRSLRLPKPRSSSKSAREWSIATAALLLYVHKLKLDLAALIREYRMLHAVQRRLLENSSLLESEIKVERISNVDRPSFMVRVTCEKTKERLVSILGVLEELSLNVMQATVSCNGRLFAMEAVVVAGGPEKPLAVTDVTRALVEAIENDGKRMEEIFEASS